MCKFVEHRLLRTLPSVQLSYNDKRLSYDIYADKNLVVSLSVPIFLTQDPRNDNSFAARKMCFAPRHLGC